MPSSATAVLLFVLVCVYSCQAVPTQRTVYGQRHELNCPDDNLIAPCICNPSPRNLVACDAVKDMDTILDALAPHFLEPIPRMRITNIRDFEFPAFAFETLQVQRLYIHNSTFKLHKYSFVNLDNLGVLTLSEDNLETVPIDTLKEIDHIQTLSLARNTLTKLNKQSFEGLKNLKVLILNYNMISEIEDDTFPKSLEMLHLCGNRLISLSGFLRPLSNLKWFTATGNKIENINGIFIHNKKLNSLDLSFNKLSNLRDNFKQLEYLENLKLSGNDIAFTKNFLDPLINLKSLDLSGNYLTKTEETIGNLKQLQSLDLSRNFLSELSGTFSKSLRKLRILNVANNYIDYVHKDVLKKMPDLVIFDISHNKLKKLGWETGYNSNLKSLLLQHNQLTSLVYEDLKGMTLLRRLDISYNNITEIGKSLFRLNKDLRLLNLEGNPLKCTTDTLAALHMLERRKTEIEGIPACYLAINEIDI